MFDHLLRFTPIYQPRVWGGRRFETTLHRRLPGAGPYGESWELVDRADAQSLVSSGPFAGMALHELWSLHRHEVFGADARQPDAERFPVLIKVLDCREDLSIQVHPSEAVAAELGGEPKSEMWFVAEAEPGALIYAGVRAGVTEDDFARALEEGTVDQCITRLEPVPGDSLFLRSGRIHALGGGLLVFEVQQNSDTTYRVFDWNRVGLDGRPRALHVAESMRSIDFTDVEPVLSHVTGELVSCEFFKVTRARTGFRAAPGRARLVMPIAETTWAGEPLELGQVVLCPASLEIPGPVGEWLEIEY